MIVLPKQLLEHLEELNIDKLSVMFPHDAKLRNLQSLSITSEWEPGDFMRCSVAIPWSQIRHLTLSDVYVPSHLLFSVLKQSLRLEYCKIKPLNHWNLPPGPFHNITLSNLQSFELSIYNHSLGVEYMQRFIIPSVNILQLSLRNVDTLVYSRVIEQPGGMPRLHTLKVDAL